VSVAIAGVGLALAVRTLSIAGRELEAADLGVRAALFLSELQDAPSFDEGTEERPAGPGRLVPDPEGDALRVEYLPPSGAAQVRSEPAEGGYSRGRSWSIRGDGLQ
jgi:hypothetical protein